MLPIDRLLPDVVTALRDRNRLVLRAAPGAGKTTRVPTALLDAGERPEIVAQEACAARFHRYGLMHGWNARINQRQFALPQPMFPNRFDPPTLLVRDRLTQRLAGC